MSTPQVVTLTCGRPMLLTMTTRDRLVPCPDCGTKSLVRTIERVSTTLEVVAYDGPA